MKEGWEYKKIYEVGQVVGGTTPSTNNPNYWNGDLCWISPAELTGNHYLYDSRKKITQEAVDSKSLKLLPVGTVILSSRAPIGKVTINKVPTYCNQGFKCVICKDSLYNEYLYWWFYGHTKFLNSLGTGATFAEISKKVVENIIIPIPSIDEQRRIVSYLDSSFKLIDEIKNKALKSLKEAKALFQSALAEAMEPKEGWEEKTLGEICFIARGGSPRPIKNFLTEDESGIPWIKIGDTEIGGKFINCTKEKIKKEGIKSSRFVRKGDFLLSNSMSFGRPYILKTDGCIHDGWLVLQNFKDTFIDDFLYYLLSCNYVQKQFDEYAYGSTVRNLKTDSVSRVSVNYPPLPTQKRIVSRLDKLSSKVRAIEEKYQKMVEECDALKQAMLRDVFE